ncbi:hypothetical protein GCM10029978_055230 [Actinoallomurus acanthiterrae]
MPDLAQTRARPFERVADPASIPASTRDDFPILNGAAADGPLVYLDNAATTQKPRAVLDAIVEFYSTANSNVGRGYYRLSRTATERYEQARATVQEELNAEHADEVVFTRSTTDAVNLLADAFGGGIVGRADQVVVSGMEHNSNLLPWRRLCERSGAELVVVPVNEHGRVEPADFPPPWDRGCASPPSPTCPTCSAPSTHSAR